MTDTTKPAPHADRDGSERRRSMEREHERGLAADKAEPERVDEDRVRKYAEAIGLANNGETRTRAARAVMAVADAEQAELRAEAERLQRELEFGEEDALGQARIEVSERLGSLLLDKKSAEAALAEAQARLAAVEALLKEWGEILDYQPSHYDRGRVDQRHMAAEELAAALEAAE